MDNEVDLDALLTEQQLADFLEVGRRTVRNWRYQGLRGVVLEPVAWIGGQWRFSLAAYQAWQSKVDQARQELPRHPGRGRRGGTSAAERGARQRLAARIQGKG